jgi:phospholipid/cholesterol/gamma-HCH transport system substrate-binding protein
VELIPGPRSAPPVPEGGELASSQVEPSVTLDDILASLTPKTRRAFQVWMQSLAAGFNGHGEQLNATFAALDPFVENANQLVGLLAAQEGAVTAVVHNTGVVFDALTERDHQLQGFITNGDRTIGALAQSSQAFATAFRELPAFERNSSVALRSLDSFATAASPVLDEFVPVEQQLAPLLHTVKRFSPSFNDLLTDIGPLTTAAKRGLPAVKKQLDLTVPLLESGIPFTKNFNPLLEELSRYVPEVQALLANTTAATEAVLQEGGGSGPRLHFLRAMPIMNPDSFSLYAQRTGFNRSNPYQQPGAFNSLASGLPVFSNSTCTNAIPTISGPGNAQVSEALIELLVELGYIRPSASELHQIIDNPARTPAENEAKRKELVHRGIITEGGAITPLPTSSCNQQAPFSVEGQPKQFPQVPAAKR